MGDVEEQLAFERRYMRFIRLDDWLLESSKFYRWTRTRTTMREGRRLPERVPIEKSVANLEAMIELATEHQARVFLLSFWKKVGGRPRRQGAIASAAAAHGLPMVTYDGPRFDYVHPTVEGHRALAEEIAAEMERAGYLQ
jgi:lysophospholipase L1-like esterase